MFDVFVADLRCPNCGAVAPITANTGIQTHLRTDADGSSLGVGFGFAPEELTTAHILGAGYALIQEPKSSGPIRLLDVWTCPNCETEQWAMVTIEGDRIARIEAVRLDRAAITAANFISETNAELVAEQYGDPRAEDVISLLRKNLPG